MALLDPPSPATGSVASDLKAERERRNVALAQIAAQTNISLRHLHSLEEGRFGDLPGGMYNRAIIRAYCECLRTDPKPILERYEAELSPAAEKASRSRRRIPRDNKFERHYPIIVWSIMLLLSATGLFFSRKWIASVFSPYFSRPPAPAAPYGTTARPASSATATSPETSTAAAASEPAGNQAAVEPVSASTPLCLEIEAAEESWISVQADERPALSRLLKAGETQSLSASERFLIHTGNAGGVRLKINGRALKKLGKPGEVVKVQLDRMNFEQFIDQPAG
jgi:cytoskeletal protein RodZ